MDLIVSSSGIILRFIVFSVVWERNIKKSKQQKKDEGREILE